MTKRSSAGNPEMGDIGSRVHSEIRATRLSGEAGSRVTVDVMIWRYRSGHRSQHGTFGAPVASLVCSATAMLGWSEKMSVQQVALEPTCHITHRRIGAPLPAGQIRSTPIETAHGFSPRPGGVSRRPRGGPGSRRSPRQFSALGHPARSRCASGSRRRVPATHPPGAASSRWARCEA